MVYKHPRTAAAVGFDDADAAFLTDHGFNNVASRRSTARSNTTSVYDDDYLDIEETQRMLARHRIFTQIDFHQDLTDERFSGEGFPTGPCSTTASASR